MTRRRSGTRPRSASIRIASPAVRTGAEKVGLPAREMVSGAGHDAAYIARVAPTTMIFVPCAGGLSHNEAESTTFEECAAGAQVLLNAVLEYDQRFAN